MTAWDESQVRKLKFTSIEIFIFASYSRLFYTRRCALASPLSLANGRSTVAENTRVIIIYSRISVTGYVTRNNSTVNERKQKKVRRRTRGPVSVNECSVRRTVPVSMTINALSVQKIRGCGFNSTLYIWGAPQLKKEKSAISSLSLSFTLGTDRMSHASNRPDQWEFRTAFPAWLIGLEPGKVNVSYGGYVGNKLFHHSHPHAGSCAQCSRLRRTINATALQRRWTVKDVIVLSGMWTRCVNTFNKR